MANPSVQLVMVSWPSFIVITMATCSGDADGYLFYSDVTMVTMYGVMQTVIVSWLTASVFTVVC